MYEPEIVEAKKGRVKKNGDPDRRSTSSALNVSKARSKVKAFLKAGKQIIDNSDSESSDEIIDLVIRKKDMNIEQEEPDVIRRKPLKTVLKAKSKKAKANFVQPDSDSGETESEEEVIVRKPSKSKAKLAEMETKHKALEEQFEIMKKGISEPASKRTDTDTIDSLRKRMILKF